MKTGYPLFPVAVITILIYLVSWLFSRWGMITKKLHRKLWNTLLLITFLVAGLFGLASVIKVNYKLNLPYYDQILKWHVILGIAMVIISFFHLSWHWKYYFSRPGKHLKPADFHAGLKDCEPALTKRMPYLLLLLGLVAMINQVVYIREFMSVLAGNELVVGVVLSCWMLLTGWGAYSGRHRDVSGFNLQQGVKMLVTLAFLPVVLVGALYWLKSLLFPPGTLIGLPASVAGIILLLFPVCFLSGYLFTTMSAFLSLAVEKNLTGKAYAFESLGSLAGGLIFSLILGRFFNSFQIFGLTTGLACLTGIRIMGPGKVKEQVSLGVAGILIPLLIFIFNPDTLVKKMLYPNQEIVLDQSTRYGNLVVTRQAGQLNFYENNSLQFYTENMALTEEAVHFAMVQHDHPRQVLLISGGISGMIREIRKYQVQKITYLEINPEIFRYWNSLAGYDEDPGLVEFVKEDIRTFLRKNKTVYDVILINLPPPSTLGFNRFYTSGFFRTIRKHCTKSSVICTSLPSTANYAGKEALEVNASLWKTLGRQFQHLLLLTGEKNYFLASGSALSSRVAALIGQKGIETSYVNPYYLDDALLARRGRDLTARFDPGAKINRDFYPYMFIQQISDWLSLFGISYYLLIFIPLAFFLVGFFRQNAVSAGLYTGGFTSASLEITLLLGYQIFFGSIYLATAFFFTVFMGGLVLGSFRNNKQDRISSAVYYARLQFFLALYALLLPLGMLLADRISGWGLPAHLLFFILVFVPAFITGHEFNVASRMREESYSEISGRNYSTDLAGSALGSFLASIAMMPVLGLTLSCVLVALLNVFSGIWAWSGKGKVG